MLYTCYIRVIYVLYQNRMWSKYEPNGNKFRCILTDKIIPDDIVSVGSRDSGLGTRDSGVDSWRYAQYRMSYFSLAEGVKEKFTS